MMTDLLSNPGAVEWWQVRGDWFSDDFRAMVDASTLDSPGTFVDDYATRLGVTWDNQAEPSAEPQRQ